MLGNVRSPNSIIDICCNKKKKKIEIEREWLQEYLGMVLKRGVFVALEMLVIPFKWAVLLYYWYVL